MKLDLISHPAGMIPRLTQLGGGPVAFEFSRYKYQPRVIEDERRSYRVESDDVALWIEGTAQALALDEDIAFHSRVYLKNERIRQIPMIDFKGHPTPEDFHRVKEALAAFQINSFEIFDSGRSFHLYGMALLTQEEWLRFLGRILLINLPGGEELVDTRWVGHRIMAGYGTLRWTKNNPHYQKLPTKLQEARFQC